MINGKPLKAIPEPQLLGEKQWTFFPNKAEKDINRRIALLYDFSKTVINKRINQIKEKGFKQNVDDYDFLDVHLNEYLSEKNEAGVTEREIISQFITLFFAGTDTTSSLAALCLFYLVKYPNVLTSLLSEINQVVGDGDVLDSQLPKLQELNSFIWEVLRSRNPASGPLVRVAKHDLMIKDLSVKKGWIVIPSNFVQQQTDKYFENYEEFDHKKFMKQNIIKDDNGYVNVPFSAGPRNCIGQHMAMMEIKIMLCHILRHYEIKEVPEKMKNLQWKGKFLYSFDPIDCRLHKVGLKTLRYQQQYQKYIIDMLIMQLPKKISEYPSIIPQLKKQRIMLEKTFLLIIQQ